MMVSEALSEKLSDILNRDRGVNLIPSPPQPTQTEVEQQRLKAQGQWVSAIASLETLLLSDGEGTPKKTPQGLIISAPTPILCHPHLTKTLHTGIFTLQHPHHSYQQFQLPGVSEDAEDRNTSNLTELPIFPQDPLATEQFCLVLTPKFPLLMVLGEDSLGLPAFQFSFAPQVVTQGWLSLRSRLKLVSHPQLAYLDQLVKQFTPVTPSYEVVTEFTRLLLNYFPQIPPIISGKNSYLQDLEKNHHQSHSRQQKPVKGSKVEETTDVALLQALSHEIRTPLTSIRTMTRLLLRNKDLEQKMRRLLENIDQECSEQINRMELIFRATELKSKSYQDCSIELVKTPLDSLFRQSIPRWKRQAQRRNVDLEIGLPKKLPQVVSDAGMLDQVLTGLMEKCTRSLAGGGEIKVQVTTAGHQLKLQFETESHRKHNPFKALGQLLLLQPETGSVSLNLDVTKNLFNRLGGKLIVRQRSQQGEIFTIFLPLN
ncbi:HAMP domain-containing sensor histidine kinase [Crocosphaera sp.]|uniref:sensor histidine kinase n=1 Tax=Crocosphaera sp. TaxID=2729996 RepID=UPI002604876A|nr:HAMP domain-containing sensor histidine kinase [Crocosphaera sp.]MDJ0582626.1 HAMP domain-containing sensor histidine kinase [Crocosphaera sp.]